MKIYNICGKRGLGDIVASTSFILENLTEKSHLIFHLPKGFDYSTTLSVLFDEFIIPKNITVTYELDEEWSTVNIYKAFNKFPQSELSKTWFFMHHCGYGQYLPFKTKWKQNENGPIGLSINNENHNKNYPYLEKFFDDGTNNFLSSMIDEKNYLFLGKPFSIKENIAKMSECRYVIGIDGAWAHIANSMRVPYFLVRNGMNMKLLKSVHKGHPCLKIIETNELTNYLRI